MSVSVSQSQSVSVRLNQTLDSKYPSSTNTEPLPQPISNSVSDRYYTEHLSVNSITCFTSDKQLHAAFMVVTVVTVLLSVI